MIIYFTYCSLLYEAVDQCDFVRHAFPLITHHINKQQNRSTGTLIIHAWPRLSHLCNMAKYITPISDRAAAFAGVAL